METVRGLLPLCSSNETNRYGPLHSLPLHSTHPRNKIQDGGYRREVYYKQHQLPVAVQSQCRAQHPTQKIIRLAYKNLLQLFQVLRLLRLKVFSNLIVTHDEVKGNPIYIIIQEQLVQTLLTFRCEVKRSIWFSFHLLCPEKPMNRKH